MRFCRILLVCALLLVGCSSNAPSDPPPAGSEDLPFPTAMPSIAEPSPAPTVAVATIQDQRIRDHIQEIDPAAATVVELGPGVYAQIGAAGVGPVSDYTTVFGLCSDIHAYEREIGDTLSNSCW